MADTSTVILLDAVLAELQAHLPAALATYSLPEVVSWQFGQRELTPTTKTPAVVVDISGYTQDSELGGTGLRHSRLVVYALISAKNEETLHRYLIGYADVLTAMLETVVTVSTIQITVEDVDFSPSYSLNNRLYRAVLVNCQYPNKLHTRGDI